MSEPEAPPAPGGVTSAEASSAQRTRVLAAARPRAPRRTEPTSTCTSVRRPRFASAKPTQRRRRPRAGGGRSLHGITRPLSCAMCAGPIPGTPSVRQPNGMRRAAAGSRGSFARSPDRFRAGSRAPPASPSSGRAAPTARSRRPEGSPPQHYRRLARDDDLLPSATGAARLTVSSCAFRVAPPAARSRRRSATPNAAGRDPDGAPRRRRRSRAASAPRLSALPPAAPSIAASAKLLSRRERGRGITRRSATRPPRPRFKSSADQQERLRIRTSMSSIVTTRTSRRCASFAAAAIELAPVADW